ncbi:MAG: hypothetical protein AAF004_08870 [Pseudomonadota bacterium]
MLAAIDLASDDGRYSDQDYDTVIAAIEDLVGEAPVDAPLDHQSFVTAPWATLFASFGPKHTAGKPVVHETNLSLQSFARFPKTPIRVLDIVQEIEHRTKTYSNVTQIETIDARVQATLIVHGRYRDDDDNRQRYQVDFYAAQLTSDALDAAAIRSAFQLDTDSALVQTLSPPKLYSDVVYCDDLLRINYGSMSGIYVMKRLKQPFQSVKADA